MLCADVFREKIHQLAGTDQRPGAFYRFDLGKVLQLAPVLNVYLAVGNVKILKPEGKRLCFCQLKSKKIIILFSLEKAPQICAL